MKKILCLLTIFISIAVQAQISNYELCDLGGDGIETFDLNTKIPEIIDGLDSQLYNVTFHTTYTDADSGVNSLSQYFENASPAQTIYVRVENNTDGTYTIDNFELILLSPPIVGTPVEVFSGNNINVYNLTINNNILTGGKPNYTVQYYIAEQNAINNAYPVSNPLAYVNTGSNLAWYRVTDTQTGCFTTGSIHLRFRIGTLQIPYQFTIYLCNNDGTANFNTYYELQDYKNQLVYGLNPDDYIVTFHQSHQNAINNINPSDSHVFTPHTYSYNTRVRITKIDDDTQWAVAAIQCNSSKKTINGEIPNYIIYQENPTGEAQFDLENWYVWEHISASETLKTFYETEQDALNGVNPILNTENYVNTANPQTIYVSAINTVTGDICEPYITSFQLYVLDDIQDVIIYIPDTNLKTAIIAQGYDINNDGEIQTSEGMRIISLDVSDINVSELTGINSFKLLKNLNCSNNNITSATLQLFHLVNLNISNNPLTEINLINAKNLQTLNVENTLIQTLDLSDTRGISVLESYNCPNLISVNHKNGYMDYFETSTYSNSLQLVCIDEFEIYLTYFSDEVILNSYCSFNPEGNYNTITGSVLYDFDNNGCDENDVIRYTKINITDGTEQGASFTNNEGNYLFFTQEGEFVITPEIENPDFFNITPVTETVIFPDNNNNEETVNFCITPNGVHNDLEVVIAPLTPARPGFEATYKIVYRNKGNQILSQDYGLNFFYNQNLMSFVSASVVPDSEVAGGVNWTYENLLPFESREIIVTMQINPSTDPENPVNIDDVLTFTSVIMPQAGDENVMDNTFIFNQTVVGAYDPNDITCIEGDVVNPDYIGEELHYVIRFENTGNYYAENVVVAMEIDEELYDVSSLRVLNSSHNVRAQVRGNMAEFFFNQIYLDSGGHGNILLVMKSMTSLEEGDAVQSKADIYFDYNYPIFTNDAITVFEEELSLENNELSNFISVYPNPATDIVTIKSETKIKSVEWYDISGRLIRISLVNDFETIQNISSESQGIYVMKIHTEKGILYHKVVKK